MTGAFSFHLPVSVRFGAGVFDELGRVTAAIGSRPLIVTGVSFARRSGLLERAQDLLSHSAVYEGVPENPGFAVCERLAEAARSHGADCLIAIGGGSAIDAAKAAAGLALNEGGCAQYVGKDTFANGALPIIAVPTTAGAGSETTPYAVLLDEVAGEKRTIAGTALFPRVALADPELTRSLPAAVTMATGLDALSQAMEGMVSAKATAIGDTLALEAIRLVTAHLPAAVRDGGDMDARSGMLYAAVLSGAVIAQSGTTLVHGMGYPLTLNWGIVHGLANGLLLAPLFRFNGEQAPATVRLMAEALGARPENAAADPGGAAARGVHDLFRRCGASPAGRDHGMRAEALDGMAAAIFAAPYRYRNQPGTMSEALIARFYREACEGV